MLPLVEASVHEHDALIAQAGCERLVRAQGWIEVFRNEAAFNAAVQRLPQLQQFNLAYDVLDSASLKQRETTLGDVAGGIHWLDPKQSSIRVAWLKLTLIFSARMGHICSWRCSFTR